MPSSHCDILCLHRLLKDYTLAGRSRSTFGKRQKEQKRQEKRLEKVQRKDQRKQDKAAGTYTDSDDQPLPDDLFVDDPTHEHEEAP